jgi:two-component system phosphate regulon sensor histidine kinase PhoR
MYAAIPLPLPGGRTGAARLAVPLDEVDAAVRKLRHILWAALGLALVVAVVLSSAAAQMLSRALGRMTEAAQQMASGDLAVRTRPVGTDEIAALGRALDVLAGNLASTLTALRTERDLLEVILQSMQEGVLVLDQESRMILVNPALRATFSLGPDAEGRAALELIRNAELQSILERAHRGAGAITGEIEITGPKPKRLLVHAASLPALNDKPQGLLAVFVDVSEIRRLETLRKDFVANVSHELRTPITAVRSAVDTLRLTLERDPGASDRFVDIIDRNAQRLGALVEDLLDLSRIESKEYRPEVAPVQLRATADQVLSLLRPRIEEKAFDVANEIAADLPAARADRKALEQVFTNLLDNAIKYCPTGTRVRVRAQLAGSVVRVEIADTGPGIEPRHLPRLFERFYRVDSGRSRDMGGTGLGLSIVKHLVEAMNGTIGVDSTPGRGATFWFTLPTS